MDTQDHKVVKVRKHIGKVRTTADQDTDGSEMETKQTYYDTKAPHNLA